MDNPEIFEKLMETFEREAEKSGAVRSKVIFQIVQHRLENVRISIEENPFTHKHYLAMDFDLGNKNKELIQRKMKELDLSDSEGKKIYNIMDAILHGSMHVDL